MLDAFKKPGNLFLSLIILTSFLVGLLRINESLGFDEGVFLSMGYFMKHGFVLYDELIDTKPPMIYVLAYLNSVLFSDNLYTPRVFMLLITTMSFIPLILICRRYFSLDSAYLAAFLMLLSPHTYSLGHVFHVDALQPFFGLWCAYLLLTGVEDKSNTRLFLAGSSLGLMLATKQTAVFLLLVSLAYLMYSGYTSRRYRPTLNQICLFLSGMLVAVIPFLIFLLQNNATSAAFSSIVSFNLKYASANINYVYSTFSDRLFILTTLLILTPLLWFLALLSIPRILNRKVNGQLFILAWFTIEFTGILLISPHIWAQHFSSVLPLACILAAGMLPQIKGVVSSSIFKSSTSTLLSFSTLFLLFYQLMVFYNAPASTFPANTGSVDESLVLGEYLKNRIDTNQTLLIIGNPAYYALSQRHPPTEFFRHPGVPYFDHWSYLFIFANQEGVNSFTHLIDDAKVDYLLIENYPWLTMSLDEIYNNTRFDPLKGLITDYKVEFEYNSTYNDLNYTGIILLGRRETT